MSMDELFGNDDIFGVGGWLSTPTSMPTSPNSMPYPSISAGTPPGVPSLGESDHFFSDFPLDSPKNPKPEENPMDNNIFSGLDYRNPTEDKKMVKNGNTTQSSSGNMEDVKKTNNIPANSNSNFGTNASASTQNSNSGGTKISPQRQNSSSRSGNSANGPSSNTKEGMGSTSSPQVSSARPHIPTSGVSPSPQTQHPPNQQSSQQITHQQPMTQSQRYTGNMTANQQHVPQGNPNMPQGNPNIQQPNPNMPQGNPNFQQSNMQTPYGINVQQNNPMAPHMVGNMPQYMPPGYRPTNPAHEDELANVKNLLLQNPELIPPPVEVLRISLNAGVNMANLGPRNIPQGPVPRGNMHPQGFSPYGGNPNPGMMTPNVAGQMPGGQRAMPPNRAHRPGVADGATTAWQSENDLPLRRKMIGKIVTLLQQRKPDAPQEWIRRLPDMARRLEDSLYRTAKNLDEYGDFGSLKTRLQHLAVTMGARAQNNKGNARPPGAMGVPGVMPGQTMGMIHPGMPQAGYMNPAMNRVAMQQPPYMQQPQMIQIPGNQPWQFTPQQLQNLTPQQLSQIQQFQMRQQQQRMHAANGVHRNPMPGQQTQPYIQGQAPPTAPPRQPNMQQTSYGMDNMNKPQHPQMQMNQQIGGQPVNYMQQHLGNGQGQHQQEGHPQLQRRTSSTTNGNDMMGANLGGGNEDTFLSLDLLGNDDFQPGGDASGLNRSMDPNDAMSKDSMSGMKRSLSQSQQQLAAAANSAAFKRSKSNQQSPQPGANQSGASGGSSKPPSLGTVNAK